MDIVLMVLGLLAAVPSPQLSWSVRSSSDTALLTQTGLPDDVCSLKCSLKGKDVWEKQTCFGRGMDFAFVSDDCGTAVLINEYPLRLGGGTPVAVSLTAGGVMRVYRLEELMDPARTKGEGRRVRWLAGVAGEPGVKPHLDAGGTRVEFSTVDGVSHSVRFTNPEDFLPTRAAAPPAQQGNGDGLYQFTDDEGATQFVMGVSQVPKKFRKRATRVESEIGVVQATKMPARPASTTRSSDSPPSLPMAAPVRVSPPAPAPAGGDCKIFGMSGPACQAVMIDDARRRAR